MATVNLSWTAPASDGDIDTLEIHRFTDKTGATQAALEAAVAGATAIKSIAKTDSEYTGSAWSDASAPIGNLTYTIIAKNSAGFKLEPSAHKDITTA